MEREARRQRKGTCSPFYSESGILGCCQVTVGRSLDKRLTASTSSNITQGLVLRWDVTWERASKILPLCGLLSGCGFSYRMKKYKIYLNCSHLGMLPVSLETGEMLRDSEPAMP